MEYERNEYGELCTRLNGKLHSFDDKSAKIYANGDQFWYKEDKLHRDGDLPAIIHANGSQHWYKEGKLHRDHFPGREDDLPAVICADKVEWWVNGELIKSCNHYNPRVKSARNI